MINQTYTDEHFTVQLTDEGIVISQHRTGTVMRMDIPEGRSILDMFEFLHATLKVLRDRPLQPPVTFNMPFNLLDLDDDTPDVPDDISGLDE